MKELHQWFFDNRREFPWRSDPTPYKVWISEVMLQQTRASVVIPYFERWLSLFPDVHSLASAPLESVIKAWEGLGYYSRARNLHRAASQIISQFGGTIPSTKEELLSIHGLGPYTVGAILSFGFRKRAIAVDGNVTRVLTRLFLIEEEVSKQSVRRKIEKKGEEFLDPEAPWITVEALIELGATICTPNPKCQICPLQKMCLGQERAHSLPIKKPDKETIQLHRAVLLIESQGQLLVKKGEAGKVMADLYEFPYFEMEDQGGSHQWILQQGVERFALSLSIEKRRPRITHTFTRYKAHLYPYECRAEKPLPIPGYEWVAKEHLKTLPFSSGHRRLV